MTYPIEYRARGVSRLAISLAALAISACSSSENDGSGGPPSGEPAVRFVGRVDATDASNVRFAWSGTGIVARFSGTSLAARLGGGQQYHVHRVRLERSLVTKNYDATLKEARIVRRFLQHSRGAYTSWLANLERQIELKFAGKKK